MTKSRMIVGVVCVLAAVVLAAPLSAAADDDGPGAAGSYLFKFLGVQAFFGPGTFVPGLATLNADGTLTSVTGSDEAGPSSLFLVKNSAVHGTWSKTGPRSVGAHALYLNFSPATGEVVSITKLRIAATFDKHFQTATGDFFMSIYVCPTFVTCPDPLTTAPTVPEPSTGQPFTLERIR